MRNKKHRRRGRKFESMQEDVKHITTKDKLPYFSR